MNNVKESQIIGDSLIKEVQDSENLFSEEEKTTLFVLIRISIDFYNFLLIQNSEEYPSFESSDYILGDIRSGFDFFFMHYSISRTLNNWPLDKPMWPESFNFQEFRKLYISLFDIFNDVSLDFTKRYSALLGLWNLHFLFLTVVLKNR